MAASKAYLKNTDPRDVAYGCVVGGSSIDFHPGPFRLLPVLGWMQKNKDSTLMVRLSCLLLRVYDDKQMGTLGWHLPVNERTEATVCRILTSFGWDGRLWPIDPGWPDGASGGKEATGLKQLLLESRLFATFIFPPEPQGSRVLRIEVIKTAGDFPLAPEFPVDELVEPTDEIKIKFRKLMVEPEVFLK